MSISLTTMFERDGNEMERKITEVWKLADQGKTLSVDYTSTSPMGTTNNMFVYERRVDLYKFYL